MDFDIEDSIVTQQEENNIDAALVGTEEEEDNISLQVWVCKLVDFELRYVF
jgi:hypothetical protein